MHITRYGRSIRKAIIIMTTLTGFIIAFAIPFYTKSMFNTEVGFYTISINGVLVGAGNSENDVYEALASARKRLSAQYSEEVYMSPDIEVTKENKGIAERSSVDELSNEIYSYLFDDVLEVERDFAYTLRIDDYTVTLSSLDEIEELLNKIISQYDSLQQYTVSISSSEQIDSGYEVNLIKVTTSTSSDIVAAAIGGDGTTVAEASDVTNEGITSIEFAEDVSIVAIPSPKATTVSVDEAYADLTKTTTVDENYVVSEGEDLEFIATKYNTTVSNIVSLNPNINEDTVLVAGDIITVPRADTILTVVTTKRVSFQESYDEAYNYTEDDTRDKYDNEITKAATSGIRYTEADIVYYNDTEMSRNYLLSGTYVIDQAEAGDITVGTKSSSKYSRPLADSVGTYKSGYLEEGSLDGVIWTVDSGTKVLAAADGTVTKAGWYSEYGYMVEITHSDGSITRYGYLSEIDVSIGDTVTAGKIIGKSGSSGAADEDELLFEIWINGSSVNPLDYVNKN